MDSEQEIQPSGRKSFGPIPSYEPAQYEQAYDLYFNQGFTRTAAAKAMGLAEGQILHLARTHKRRLEAKNASKDENKHGE